MIKLHERVRMIVFEEEVLEMFLVVISGPSVSYAYRVIVNF